MKIFKDSEGNEWQVSINVFSIKRVIDMLDINLCSISDGKDENASLLTQLMTDHLLICNVLYCLCKDQADKREKTDEDFGRLMFGDAISRGREVVLAELINFIPDDKHRTVLSSQIKILEEVAGASMDKMMNFLKSPEVKNRIEQVMAKLDLSFTESPELSE